MAKLRSVIGSGFAGRIGNVVGVRSKGGEYVIRARAEEVKNPNTLRQRVSRLRMATASKLASGLAAAIQSGYAFSTNGTKMYPRNMFVAGLVKDQTNLVVNPSTMAANITYGGLKVAKRNGIAEVPAMGAADFDTPQSITIPYSAQSFVDVLPAGDMGLVVVAYCPELNACAMGMVKVTPAQAGSVTMAVPTSWAGMDVHVYAFFKFIPETGNDIATDTEPWKYPAQTGDSVYVGTGNIG